VKAERRDPHSASTHRYVRHLDRSGETPVFAPALACRCLCRCMFVCLSFPQGICFCLSGLEAAFRPLSAHTIHWASAPAQSLKARSSRRTSAPLNSDLRSNAQVPETKSRPTGMAIWGFTHLENLCKFFKVCNGLLSPTETPGRIDSDKPTCRYQSSITMK
jgi:hypothetical protein